MAQFVRDVGDDRTPEQHDLRIFHEHLKLFSMKGISGPMGSGASIIMDTSLTANVGDKKVFHFVPHAFGDDEDPIRGQDAEILGNEKAIDEDTFEILIDEVNFALRKKGKMTDQRVVFDIGNEQERQIINAFAQYNENTIVKILSGVPSVEKKASFESATNSTVRVNGEGRIIRATGPNGSKEILAADSDNVALAAGGNEAIGTNDTISPTLIENAVIMARESGKHKMYPLRVGPNNEEFFLLFLSLRVGRDLRKHPDWQNYALSIIEAGLGNDMIAAGAFGVWDNVIVKSSERIVTIVDGSNKIARNLLVGSDAAVIAWAQTMEFTEEIIDHRRRLSSNGNEIRGESKITFEDSDMGVAQVITASN